MPILTAVYSGYTTYFSTPTQPLSDVDLSLRTQHGRNFLWGVVVGWNEPWILKENFKDELDFDLMLGAHRHATKDFMVHGELLGELQPTEDVPSLDVTWHYRVPHDVSMPAVQGTVWEALDGRRCVYILNYEDSINSFSFKLPVPDGKAPWLLRRITPNGCAPLALVESDSLSWTAHLKPQELLVLSMEKAEGRARAVLKEAKALVSNSMDDAIKNAASQFIVSQNNKARLHIGSCMEFVKGESADFEYSIENSGKAAKLEIIWPNGLKEKKKVPAKSNEKHVAMLDMSKMEGGIGTVTVGDGKYSYAIPVALREVPAISAEIDLPSKMFAGERTYARLTVSNNSRHTKEATIVICAPESWNFLPSRTIHMQNLRGKSKRHFNVGCVIGEQPEDSAEQIQLLVQQNIGASAVSVLKTRPKVIGHAATITIDGKLDEWSDTDIVTIDESCKDKIFYTQQGQEYGGNGDHSVRSRVAWDADCLYFAFEVTDDIHVNPSRDDLVWNGDMIQIELMPNGPAEKSSDPTVRQFAFACDNEGPFMFQWNMSAVDGASLGNGVQKSCRIACARGANGNVTYEAAVPWKALQLEPPKANSRFGYSFVVSDNDKKDMKGWLQLTPGIFGEKNPAEFGWLILRQ